MENSTFSATAHQSNHRFFLSINSNPEPPAEHDPSASTAYTDSAVAGAVKKTCL